MTLSWPSFSAAWTRAAMLWGPLAVNWVTLDQSTELPPPDELLLPQPTASTTVPAVAIMAKIALLIRTLLLRPIGTRGLGRENSCEKKLMVAVFKPTSRMPAREQ